MANRSTLTPHTLIAVAISRCESLGSAALDILGFGGLVDKFEQHCGARFTKLVLATIGIALLCVAGKTIWDFAVYPIGQFVIGAIQSNRFAGIAWLGFIYGGIFGVVYVGSLTAYQQFAKVKLKKLSDEAWEDARVEFLERNSAPE